MERPQSFTFATYFPVSNPYILWYRAPPPLNRFSIYNLGREKKFPTFSGARRDNALAALPSKRVGVALEEKKKKKPARALCRLKIPWCLFYLFIFFFTGKSKTRAKAKAIPGRIRHGPPREGSRGASAPGFSGLQVERAARIGWIQKRQR